MRTLLLIVCLALGPVCWAGETVRVGVNHAPPYRIVDGDQFSGLYVEIFEEIARRLDWELHFVEAPFRRILLMMEQGEVDVMLGPLRTEDREVFMDYILPVFPPERRLFFYTQPENRILSYDDLYQKRIGVLRGSHYFPTFDDDANLIKEPGIRYENLMRMLQRGYVDVVIAPELVGIYTLKQEGVRAEISPFFVPGERSWIALSRKSRIDGYADAIRQVVSDMQEQHILDRLVLQYLQWNNDQMQD